MSIKLTAYDTTACSSHLTRMIEDSLNEAYIQSSLAKEQHQSLNSEFDFNYNLVQGGDTFVDHVPFFGHPILFKTGDKDRHGQPIKELALDVRNFGKYDPHQRQFIIRNNPEYNWAVERTILQNIWLKGRYELIRDVSSIPCGVYAALISECLARRLSLDLRDQITISILSAYYYFSNFTNESTFDEMEFTRIKSAISRATRIPSEEVDDVLSIFEGPQPINSLEFLCDSIKAKTGNEALQMLNVGLLISLISGLWWGHNAKEIMAVGLDHPPTWVMIVYASIQDNTYKRSLLTKTSSRFERGGAGLEFVSGMKNLINES